MSVSSGLFKKCHSSALNYFLAPLEVGVSNYFLGRTEYLEALYSLFIPLKCSTLLFLVSRLFAINFHLTK